MYRRRIGVDKCYLSHHDHRSIAGRVDPSRRSQSPSHPKAPPCTQSGDIAVWTLLKLVPAERFELPTNGLQIAAGAIETLNNQSLAALATPHSSLVQSQIGHSQPGIVTSPAQAQECARPAAHISLMPL